MKTAHFLKSPERTSQDLSAAALSYTTTQTRAFKLEEITIKADQNITETITITRDSAGGASYDAVLATRSMVAESSFVFRPQGECNFRAGENVKVQCTQANGVGILYVEVLTSEM